MKRYIQILLLIYVIQCPKVYGQYVLKEADAQFELFNYYKAIDLYQQAFKKKKTLYTAEKLVACYSQVHDYPQLETWSAKVLQMDTLKAESRLSYAMALQNNSKYTEAKLQYQKYGSQSKGLKSNEFDRLLKNCDSATHWLKKPEKILVRNEEKLNTVQSDWGAKPFKNLIVFSSDRAVRQGIARPFFKFDRAKLPDSKTYGWTGNSYLKIYQQDTLSGSTELFPLNTGSNYHIGPASFSADGKEVYFTITRIPDQSGSVKAKIRTINMEIYSSKMDEQYNWIKPVPFKYNKVMEYSVGDPFISKDGNTLYFVSNMPNGIGGTDLYLCRKTSGGEWDVPVNLKELNTEGNERTPALDDEGNIYFSSDGLVGMGGLDIYKAIMAQGKPLVPVNLGYPVNSPQDDFAYVPTTELTGYFSSNRPGGLGSDDIYSFRKIEIQTVKKDPDLKLAEIGKVFKLENIYYNFNQWEIRADAKAELDKVVRALKANPSVWIELASHTDSRGDDGYNKILSQKRADAALEYMVGRGIDKFRIRARGYGESRLLNKCSNAVPCSEADHQINRRTEFTVVKR